MHDLPKRRTACSLPAGLLLLALPVALHAAEAKVLHDFGAEGFQVAYEAWKDKAVPDGGATVIKSASKGGGLVNRAYDLAGWENGTPTLVLKVLDGNEETALHLVLRDGTGSAAMWVFPLAGLKPGETSAVHARDAATLGSAGGDGGKPKPKLSQLTQFHIQGSFRGNLPLAVALVRLEIRPDSPALQDVRSKAEAAKTKARAPDEKPKPVDLTPIPRTPKSPAVTHIGLVAPDLLALDIEAGTYIPSRLLAYKAEPGDAFIQKKDELLLKRGGKEIAWVLDEAKTTIRTFDGKDGDDLQTGLADQTTTYLIVSAEDPAYRGGKTPTRVFRKSKPAMWPDLDKLKAPMRHTVYLGLPAPLKIGAAYTLSCGELNTREPRLTYRHEPAITRSEAVHVSQIGYRPDDPAKRGYLSVWLGTGGARRYDPAPGFRLVDDQTGAAVFEGKAVLAVAADQPEKYKLSRNYNQTDVLHLDFSAVRKPGTYRLVADGIGSSERFEIGREVWTEAFVKAARGFYHQRTGMKLGLPHTVFDRPLNFREESGCRFQELSADPIAGQEKIGEDTKGYKTGKLLHGVWGGYHDAGDWDMRIHHVNASLAHLTLLELFPEFFAKLKHNIPDSANALPDLLDEAVWNVGLYLRLQREDGLVYHGVEEEKGLSAPRRGAPSWMHKELVVYPADLWTTAMYAGAAAAVAHHLQPYDAPLSANFRDGALKALTAVEAGQKNVTDPKELTRLTDARALAAVELYRLTRDARWHEHFKRTTALAAELPALGAPTPFVYDRQGYATFLYARLDDALADAALKAKAREAILRTAESERLYSLGNAFDAAHPVDSMPNILGFWTSPTVMESCWAHFLTGEAKYLETALRACNYGAGANPANLVFTTGVGQTPVRHPLHLDSHYTGQPAPEGLTLYGPADWKYWGQGNTFFDWGFKWFFSRQCTPNAYEWPVTEAYFDVFGFPSMNEFTVMGPMERTCFVWGYLAARK
jgi:endoglucanase